MRDALVFGVDIDPLQEHEQVIQQCHIGMSILDTRQLQSSLTTGSSSILQIIQSYHYVIGSPKFAKGKSNKFFFGQVENISMPDLKLRLEALISHRSVVLACHGDAGDLNVLGRLGIDLHPLCTIDTVKAAQYPRQLSYRYSLERLLSALGVPFANLHISGIDAHFVALSSLDACSQRRRESECGCRLSKLVVDI